MSITVPANVKPSGGLVLPGIPKQRGPKAKKAPVVVAPTRERLFSAPLSELIVETDVELIDSSITDVEFFGAVVVRPGKRTVVLMPTERSNIEKDVITRYLIGQSFGIPMTPLPTPFDVEVHPIAEGAAA